MISGQSLPTSQGILPDGPHLALFEAAGGELQRLCRLPFASLDKFAANTEGWVASISGIGTPRVTTQAGEPLRRFGGRLL